MKKCLFVLTWIIGATLSSCQDPGLLLPGLDTGESKALVVSIEQGSIQPPLGLVPLAVSIAADASQDPDALTVRLLKGDGAFDPMPILELKFNKYQLKAGTLPALRLPNLKPGSYRLLFQLYHGSAQLRQESLVFFVSPEKPDIKGIVVQPGTLVPGGDGFLELLLDPIPAGEAYVRWSSGSSVLKGALINAGGGRVAITAPLEEGIYTYRAEWFPQAPSGSGDFDFSSPYVVENRVVVAKRMAFSRSDFGPDGDFLHVLHLKGVLADTGRAAQDESSYSKFSLQGGRQLDQAQEVLGYVLGAGSSIHFPRGLIPDFQRQFPAFAVKLRLLLLESRNGVLYRSRSDDGSSGMELSIGIDAKLTLRIWGLGFEKKLHAATAMNIGAPIDIHAGLAGSPAGIQLLLAVDDAAFISDGVADLSLGPAVRELAVEGATEIGLASGPRFLLDEYGIYQPETPVQAVYFLAMHYRFGKALAFASAFNSGQLPAGFAAQGDVRLANGRLMFGPGAAVSLPTLAKSGQGVNLEISFAETPIGSAEVLSLEAKGMEPVRIRLDGSIVQGSRQVIVPGFSFDPLKITLQPTKDGYNLLGQGFVFPILADQASGLTFRLSPLPQTLGILDIEAILSANKLSSVSDSPVDVPNNL